MSKLEAGLNGESFCTGGEVGTAVTIRIVPRRGRKAGVKTVALNVDESRRQWLKLVMAEPGLNAELCRRLVASDSFVSHLLAGRRTFTNSITWRIEDIFGLARGSIDAGVLPSLKRPITAGVLRKPAVVLDRIIERVLTEMLATALRERRVSNSAALRLLEEIVEL